MIANPRRERQERYEPGHRDQDPNHRNPSGPGPSTLTRSGTLPAPSDGAQAVGRGSDGPGLLTARDRDAHGVAPLGPRAVVVPDVVEAEQVGQDEPGVAAPLPDPAVGDDVVAGLEALLADVDGLELVAPLEGRVLRRGARPRDAARTGDVATAQGAFLRVLGHVGPLAGVLLRRADVDERVTGVPEVGEDVVLEG